MSQSRELPSMLFYPRTSEKQLDSYRSRSPLSTRSPSTPAYGRSTVVRESSATRRRSMTPPGGSKDTPPLQPPPTNSLFNFDKENVTQPEIPPTDGYATFPLQREESTSYGEAPEDTWVTIYGFQPGELPTIMREFAKCGDVLLVGSGREDKVNWVHIKYASNHQAQRALLKSGQVIAARLMVGVKPLEERHRAAAESLAGAINFHHSLPHSLPRPLTARPYRLDGPSKQDLPIQATSAWAKFKEFVLGM